MNPYVLGVLWAIGGYTKDEYDYFFLRHKERYFLDVVRNSLGVPCEVFLGDSRTGPQYKLKIFHLDLEYLESLGWQPRTNEQRDYPAITEHRDFIRAYLEIHSGIDSITIRKIGRPPYTQPRLRIYGNKHFLEQLSQVLAAETGVGIKRVQKATNSSASSGILYYQSRPELEILFNYLYQPEIEYYHREHYDNFREILKAPG